MEKVDRIELHYRFGGRLVALRGDEVMASAVTHEKLIQELARLGVDRRDVIIEFVEPANAICIY
jgi:hypothetical protein